jgi:hypothetical protein
MRALKTPANRVRARPDDQAVIDAHRDSASDVAASIALVRGRRRFGAHQAATLERDGLAPIKWS